MSSEDKFLVFIRVIKDRAEIIKKAGEGYLGPETRYLIAALYTLLREKK